MKYFTHYLVISLSIITSKGFAQDDQDQIIGFWDTGKAKVEIYESDGRYIGNPINPEGARNEQIEILNLEYKDRKWLGQIFSVERKKRMDVICEVKGETLKLEVKAGFMTRDLEWTRTNP